MFWLMSECFTFSDKDLLVLQPVEGAYSMSSFYLKIKEL
jgi:hypothetical protein